MTEPIDKEQLREKILELEGISEEEKLALVRLLESQKRYGLVWEDKPEDIEEQLKEQLPVLKEVKERALTDGGEEAPNHILIEGDNLAALTALSYTHEGKIDVIYIDPPYNTGNKDFVYNDSFVDSEDGYRHSKWLSFMDKRLRIAKRLLSDKGVIFISIDDNEQANLKLLCDEVFGSDKLISNFIWQKKTGAADAKGIATITEYILCYCLSPDFATEIFSTNKEAFDINRYRFSDKHVEQRGPYYYDSLDRGSIRYSDSQNYPIIAPDGTSIYPNDRTDFFNDGWTWKWSKDKVEWGLENGYIEIVENPKKKCGWSVKYKIYLNVDNEGNEIKKNVPYKNLIQDVLNSDATNEIKVLFGSKAFNYAKPRDLIQKFIKYIDNNSSTILDFFAGSGTTLHATMQLNAEDGGHRQCILVTNNENNICEEVTYERNKRVIQGYTTPKGVAVEGLTNNNLRYYKTEFLPREMTFDNKQALMRASVDLLCIKENIYTEVREFCGMKFKPSLLRYYKEKDVSTGSAQARQMLLIFDERVIEHIVPMIATLEGKLKVYVFSNGAYAYEDEFQEVRDKVEVCALPEAILQAYHKVLPQREEEVRI